MATKTPLLRKGCSYGYRGLLGRTPNPQVHFSLDASKSELNFAKNIEFQKEKVYQLTEKRLVYHPTLKDLEPNKNYTLQYTSHDVKIQEKNEFKIKKDKEKHNEREI